MAMRKIASLTLLGLVLTAVAFIGCERRIISRDQERFIPPKPPAPANTILVRIAATSASDLNGVKVVLLSGGTKIDSAVISGATTSPFPVQFDSVAGETPTRATYQVTIRHTTTLGFTLQSQLVSITSSIVPTVTFTLKKIENTQTIEVKTETVDQTLGTTVTVQQPQTVRTGITTAPVTLTIAPSSGVTSVSVSSQTAEEVPPIVQNNQVTQAVVGAIQIQTLTPNANATFSVNIPLPIDSTDRARAAGGTVDVMRYNVNTGTWTKLPGTFTIRADGTVLANVTGIDENTILSIGSTPAISAATVQAAPATVLDVQATEDRKRRGDSTYTFDLAPSIGTATTTVSKGARMAFGLPRIAQTGQALPAPAGIPGWAWPNIRAYIAGAFPVLAEWLNSGKTTGNLKLPEGAVYIEEMGQTKKITYQLTFGGLKYTFKIEINAKGVTVRYVSEDHIGTVGG